MAHMTQSLLARSAGPLAIVAGALVVVTRVVIMVTTPADIDSLKVYVLSTTHAINGVASIVAFAMLVFALVASYDLQARAAGVLGVIGLGAAILGTVFMAGDWWYEAFAVPRLAEVAPEVMDDVRVQPTAARRPDELRAVRDRLGPVRDRQRSCSCLPGRRLVGDRRGRPAVRRPHRPRLPSRERHPRAGLRRARGVVAAFGPLSRRGARRPARVRAVAARTPGRGGSARPSPRAAARPR